MVNKSDLGTTWEGAFFFFFLKGTAVQNQLIIMGILFSYFLSSFYKMLNFSATAAFKHISALSTIIIHSIHSS